MKEEQKPKEERPEGAQAQEEEKDLEKILDQIPAAAFLLALADERGAIFRPQIISPGEALHGVEAAFYSREDAVKEGIPPVIVATKDGQAAAWPDPEHRKTSSIIKRILEARPDLAPAVASALMTAAKAAKCGAEVVDALSEVYTRPQVLLEALRIEPRREEPAQEREEKLEKAKKVARVAAAVAGPAPGM
ncbi:MAG TPA: hypothetical protein ENJ40_07955 [Thermosulfurimonas dismutans]|uniref:Uncharacterized protein n=1 Tax=Thermosulfurimonas dismutans TaxID=999894 RepID=A0A7C3CGX2_9BACT|nr:hypothetical protein [Thermosulfurimonas dismutans]